MEKTKTQKIKELMNLPIQKTFGAWNKLSLNELNKYYEEAINLGILK